MACFHPLIAYARLLPDGKKDLFFVKHASIEFDAPFIEYEGHIYRERLELPCGQCIGCRMAYSREWATRCMLEAQRWKQNYFLTITYDDDHLPYNFFPASVDPVSGEVLYEDCVPTLVKKDLQSFMKLLRRECEYHFGHTGLRFFSCGEYGSRTHRPHYHMILFNAPVLDDLIFYKRTKLGDILYNSPFLDKVWKKGYIVIGNVSYESCCYTARYMLKKHKGLDADYYEKNHLAPEFTNCSRRPGIAFDYFSQNKDGIYHFDEIVLPESGKVVKPPKYFDRLFDVDSPEDFAKLRRIRMETAVTSRDQKLAKTCLTASQYLELEEKILREKLKFLPRDL